jgi:hypothetical protein
MNNRHIYLFFLFASQGPLDSQLEDRERTKDQFLEIGLEIQDSTCAGLQRLWTKMSVLKQAIASTVATMQR